MEKYFVNYNQALALSKLWFDEPCMKEFHKQNLLNNSTGEEINNSMLNEIYGPSVVIAAPLKSQVLEWFRTKYNLLGFALDIDKPGSYYYGISELFSGETIEDTSEGPYNNKFEEAESDCIDKLIEIINDKK